MYKKLLASVREYKKESIEAPFYVSLEVVMECLIPFIVARLVNNIRAGCELRALLFDGALLIIMAFMSLLFGIFAGNACSTASCGFAKNLRSDLFRAIQKFSFANIDKFSTASLVTRLTADVSDVQQAYMMIVRTAIRGPLMLIFAFVMAFIMGGRIALVFMFTVPFLGLGIFFISRWAMPEFRKLFKKYDALNNSIQENIHAMRVVKAFVREDYEKEKFSRSAGDLCSDFTRAEKILALNTPMMHFCIDVVMIFILYYGTYKIVTTRGLDLNIGQIASLITYGMQILGSLMRFSMVFVMITLARESAARIVEVLDEVPEITSPVNGLKEVADGSITFQNVSFKYHSNKNFALSNINLKIDSGSTIGIIGGTGSSKSTLVQLIPRLYDPSEGVIKVGGQDVREYNLDSLRNSVAVVLQKNELFSGTIRENLLWGDESASDSRIQEVCKIACADEFIERLPEKYNTRIEQNGRNLSGGQKQRLCIARALLKSPKILILDDSTSAVDTHTDALIRDSLRKYMPDVTKIIIAQRISSVQDADKIILLEGGEVKAAGTHDELLKSDKIYHEIYLSQNNQEI
ncbi:MAG: ABC transporter ATP-binding protein [Synergistaceae bacterium]|nr:ABC transporter ATP-binding protein [Synergistaceae bacterium]